MTGVMHGMNRHICTCWYALAPLPLKASDHLLLCALFLLLQLHHPLHQHLHLHRSVNQLEEIKREKGLRRDQISLCPCPFDIVKFRPVRCTVKNYCSTHLLPAVLVSGAVRAARKEAGR